MKNFEKRSFSDVEIKTEKDGENKCVIGLIPYNSKSVEIYGLAEIISPSAFKKTLNDGATVRALVNHNEDKILGSTNSGTLTLEDSPAGLVCRCTLPNTSYANDMYEIIGRGDVQTMSFGFDSRKSKWLDDYGKKTRTLKEVCLKEVSFSVMTPAYPDTASLTYLRGLNKMGNLDMLNEIFEKETLDEKDILNVKEAIDALTNLLGKDEGKPAEEATSGKTEEPAEATPTENVESLEQKDAENAAILFEMEAELAMNNFIGD